MTYKSPDVVYPKTDTAELQTAMRDFLKTLAGAEDQQEALLLLMATVIMGLGPNPAPYKKRWVSMLIMELGIGPGSPEERLQTWDPSSTLLN